MAKKFTAAQWAKIFPELKKNSTKYGVPERVYGSSILASFNIRKLGAELGKLITRGKNKGKRKEALRDNNIWKFLGLICRNFDLLAVQEVLEDLSGLERLRKEMSKGGEQYATIVSDITGVFPGEAGNPERLAFLYRPSVIHRGDIVSDLTYDRTKVLQLLDTNLEDFRTGIQAHRKALQEFEKKKKEAKAKGEKGPSGKPKLVLPFIGFIRQPYAVSFRIVGMPGTKPYEFIAVNAHLVWGSGKTIERDREFRALMEWIRGREEDNEGTNYPGVILLGDLNLDFDNTKTDFKDIEPLLEPFKNKKKEQIQVKFPFLFKHPDHDHIFRTNARLKQTYDQIGFFFRGNQLAPNVMKRLAMEDMSGAGQDPRGPDYGVVNFVELFSQALHGKPYAELPKKASFLSQFDNSVSDHMPLWTRIPLPEPK